ncbi:hypothetical protein SAMN04487926_119106 [Paraburkholderia steynii]|uniref:Uncharacterized protein n=1 Tax=Paraburkholderia steynii TaxID=1245441 RepID=A0A7Z7FLI6_9BURK|nr:hypothetical protein [Paraburkholderia steynii]SDI57092.1 hypothetical protein SAMN04487926_119106 [Paraburkholderia steynii]
MDMNRSALYNEPVTVVAFDSVGCPGTLGPRLVNFRILAFWRQRWIFLRAGTSALARENIFLRKAVFQNLCANFFNNGLVFVVSLSFGFPGKLSYQVSKRYAGCHNVVRLDWR